MCKDVQTALQLSVVEMHTNGDLVVNDGLQGSDATATAAETSIADQEVQSLLADTKRWRARRFIRLRL